MVKWVVLMKIQPSICLDAEENHVKPQSGWSAPGFEPGTSRMRVSCVTTEPPRSVFLSIVCHAVRSCRKCDNYVFNVINCIRLMY